MTETCKATPIDKIPTRIMIAMRRRELQSFFFFRVIPEKTIDLPIRIYSQSPHIVRIRSEKNHRGFFKWAGSISWPWDLHQHLWAILKCGSLSPASNQSFPISMINHFSLNATTASMKQQPLGEKGVIDY
ncbi:uncharacterized protein LOC143880156 isoform X2 [Tasmannia lanceolata]|uniref:uncharacterized protein LOC143880156 isoform X2 n=1 Tax=Tasmannia lanceolata TaxID=3420 RepID=UPI004064B0E4